MADDAGSNGGEQTTVTMSHLLGEMTWLLAQSPLHRELKIADLEWLIMPPLLHKQFYIFRDGQKPVGLALWAKCNSAAEEKLKLGPAEPQNHLTLYEWKSGERIWLVELVAPFADPNNKHREIMLADLISGPLSGLEFNFHETDPATGRRTVRQTPADAGTRLKEAVEAAIAEQ